MMGRSHVMANVCSVLMTGSLGYIITEQTTPAFRPAQVMVQAVMDAVIIPQNDMPWAIWLLGCGLLFWLGSLLPDIDSSGSMLGRYIHLPFEHRTWTHAIWLPAALFAAAIWYRSLFWLALGYFLHLFWDSLSYGGVCFFYPISGYRKYAGGAKVKRRHKIKLYRSGKTSEAVVLTAHMTLTLALVAFALYTRFG